MSDIQEAGHYYKELLNRSMNILFHPNTSSGQPDPMKPELNASVTSDLSSYPAEGAKAVPVMAQGVMILMYTLVVLLSVGGNTLVVYSIVAHQRMKTVTNYFILNLACADMLTAVLCIPFTLIANLLMRYWPFGHWMCPIVTYAQSVAVFLTAFTLVGISLDRFRAVLYPLKPRMSIRQAAFVIAQVWLFSLAVPLPVAILSKVVNETDPQGTSRDICKEEWNDDEKKYVYTIVIMVFQYFLPLSVLIFTYTSIGFIIWIKKTPGEAENSRDQRLAASKRKMVKMMITVVVIYALCWLPLHSITLVGDTHPSVWQFSHIQTIWIACHWLAMSNCCYNPIVYFWMNAKFRHGFRHALRWCPCVVRGSGLQGTMAIYSTVNQRQTVLSFSPGKTRHSEAVLSAAKRFSMGGGGAQHPSVTGSAVMSPYSARFQQRSSCSSSVLTSAESTTRLAGKYHGYHKQVSMELDR